MKQKRKKMIFILTVLIILNILLCIFISTNKEYKAENNKNTYSIELLENSQNEISKNENRAKNNLNLTGLITVIVFISILFIVFIILIFIKPKELTDEDYNKAIEKKERKKFEKKERKKNK